jgi:hypothetical protein
LGTSPETLIHHAKEWSVGSNNKLRMSKRSLKGFGNRDLNLNGSSAKAVGGTAQH